MAVRSANKPTLAIFGGSGRTGRQVTACALDQGMPVRALMRPASSLETKGSAVHVVAGSILDEADVARTIEGSDAVCCVFGPRPPFTDIFCAAATSLVVKEARRRGVRRLVCQTGAMVGDYPCNRSRPFQLMSVLYRRRNPEEAADREAQESLVLESQMDWIILKPPRLTEGPRSPRFEAAPDVRVGLLDSVSRADVAALMIKEILASTRVREVTFMRG